MPGESRLTDASVAVNSEEDDDHSAGSDECVANENIEVCQIVLDEIFCYLTRK